MSANGTRVSFSSNAATVVAGDTNGTADVFVRNVPARTTERVSVSSTEVQADQLSFDSDLSDDGRRVAFSSLATNLVPGATNGYVNVFVRDLPSGTTAAVVRASDGGAPDDVAYHPRLSGDGSEVLFES